MTDAKRRGSGTGKPVLDTAYRTYGTALRQYLMRRLRSSADPSDLAQEIFVRFLRKRDRPEVARNPLPYLFGIAANVIREVQHEERRALVFFDSELADEAGSAYNQAKPNPLAEEVALHQDIADALATLPANHLAAVLLLKREGLSVTEAARETGFTEGTLSVYLCEARRKLRQVLKDYARKGKP